ncbi:hypothetical protein [Oribacterium sp. WCC10]|uniref:hypothetical protein n=1 Tax=Oribacterium sp. WCC10 TaxID=1855343 RepID=UPI0008E265E2|nr:hypothetical protein [Oribacterium sp. WCC10]SFG74239.1 hypothetical protein SAMN05216356_12310 [Oribacterium sp. WCC10]
MKDMIPERILLYDIIAELCSYLVETVGKDHLILFKSLSDKELRNIDDRIQENTYLSLSEKGMYFPVFEPDLNPEYIGKLRAFKEKICSENDKNSVVRLLQALDETVSVLLYDEREILEGNKVSSEINTNRSTTGISLFPKMNCVWSRKNRQTFSYKRIDSYLRYLLVVEDIPGIEAEHIFIKRGSFPVFDKTKKINVAATPLSAKTNFEYRYQNSGDYQVFGIKYNESRIERDNALVWEKIKEAGKHGSEIIVFPEMLGNPLMETYIQEKLCSLDNEQRKQIPSLIVLPSCSVEGINYSAVLDRNGNELTRQCKQYPFFRKTKQGEYREHLRSNNKVTVFHYEGIGRFAVMICKDFLTNEYMERIMRGCMLTMIISPAYSTGSYDFKLSLDLCAHDDCNVIWVNSCAALIPGKEDNFENIGYIRKRINRYQSEEEATYRMKSCRKLLMGGCDHNCIYYDSFGSI